MAIPAAVPLVLLHGFALDQQIWEEVSPLLDDMPVHKPGFPGLSDTPMLQDCTMATLTDWLIAWLDERQIQQCVLAGHSMGGYVVMEMLARAPHRLKGVLLVHSHVYGDTPEKRQDRNKAIRFVEQHGTAVWVREFLPPLFSDRFLQAQPAITSRLFQRYHTIPTNVITAYLAAMRDRANRLEALQTTLPVGFIMGELDKHAPLDKNLSQACLPDRAGVYLMQQVAHMGMYEQPQHMAAHIRDFYDWATSA